MTARNRALGRGTAEWSRRTFIGGSATVATALLAGRAAAAPLGRPALGPSSSLLDDAKKEGQLTTIALPHDWLNYGEMIDRFKKKYGLKVNELNPDGSSGEEVEAIRANKGNKGPQAPDVIDVGFAFGPSAKKDDLLAPYKVLTWDTIPDDVKDPDGYWYGDYYGVLAFEVNLDVVKNVPQDWSDLLRPEYQGQVALAGDPRSSSQAINAVYAAALANGGSADDAMPGLAFFAQLQQTGNLLPVIAKSATVAKGETPIAIRWDYNALANRDNLNGNPPLAVVVPQTGVLAGVYLQAISAYAPHPNAARLWMEYLYSDEGQLVWLSGYGHPIRYDDLAARDIIPTSLAAQLPPAALYATAVRPTLAQVDVAKKVITENWDSVVGAQIS